MSDTKRDMQTGVVKAAGILVIAHFLSSMLGYVRDIIMSSVFDMSADMDAYNAAFIIPDLIYTILVGGGLSAAFIPVFSSYIAQHKDEEGYKMASTILNIVAIVAAVICIIGEVFAPQLLPLVTDFSTWPEEAIKLTITLTRIMFFQCFFMCLTGICMGILQSYKDFTPPSIGAILYNITIIGVGVLLLTLGTGFDMELTGRENVYLNGAIIGYSKSFLDAHYQEIVEFAELQDFMEEKVKNYSSGMVSRLGFAIATAGDAAEILILDEVLSVGDEFFRKKSLKRVKEMIHGGSTVLMVSHSMATIIDNCTKCVWIEKGELKMIGEPKEVCDAYRKYGGDAA